MAGIRWLWKRCVSSAGRRRHRHLSVVVGGLLALGAVPWSASAHTLHSLVSYKAAVGEDHPLRAGGSLLGVVMPGGPDHFIRLQACSARW